MAGDSSSPEAPAPTALPAALPPQKLPGAAPIEAAAWAQGVTVVPWTTKPRTGLLIGGSIVLGVSYLCSAIPGVIGSVIGTGDTAWPLAIPVLGPFIQIIHDAVGPHDKAIFGNPLTGGIMLGFVGLTEAAGLTMVLVGALDRRRVPDFSQHALRLAPLIAPGSSGLAILGRF